MDYNRTLRGCRRWPRFKSWVRDRLLILGIVLFITFWFAGMPILYRLSEDYVVITVSEKERITEATGDSRYLIFSESGEVFENTDSLTFFKWNSSDIYGKLREGQRYRVRVAGWRIPFFSGYRNIIDADEIAR